MGTEETSFGVSPRVATVKQWENKPKELRRTESMIRLNADQEIVINIFLFNLMFISTNFCERLVPQFQIFGYILKMNRLYFKMNHLYVKMNHLYIKMNRLYFKINRLYFKMNHLYVKMNRLYFKMNRLYLR